ncbi:hypothetical protein DFH09DRAFT_1253687 [Mycena vulgaris]|nr:hypothetical protein DFH09DRAFT_1253687 [Mycena vulgaris]
MPCAYSEDDWYQLGGPNNDDWEEVPLGTGIHMFPRGEEGVLQSHAGGEAIMHQIMEGMRPGCQGYLGGSPEKPAIAFSIRTFEIYRQIHRVCPRYTINSLAKTLSYLHKVPRKLYLAEQLTTAYNAYLSILREVEHRVQRALGRNESWDSQNVCPPCFYKLEKEVRLKLPWLGSLDGNNSLKLVYSTFRAGHPRFDNRKSMSFRWLTPSQVDKYMDEVKNSKKTDNFPDGPAEVPDDGTPDSNRWKAAGPEARKKMFALFAISGIFISVCRHGHVLVMCDMICSGELMKYPLAIVAKLFKLYGADAGIGYDIMCAFIKTLLCSSLGAKTVGLCAGLEDFEECEHTFCPSNNLASCTRLATPFHRQQQIDEHFYFHDLDKHTASGNFIFQNYRQAVEKITANSLKLRILEDELHTTAADYERDLNDEGAHLESLLREPPEVQTTADYIELLNKLQMATDSSDTAKKDFDNLDYLITVKGVHGKALTAIKTRHRTTHTPLLHVEEQVALFEEEHGYIVRWTTDSQDPERLVVQRLLELTKLSMSGVAYKLREKIGRALKTRADAVQRALIEYNTAADTLNPPQDQLVWAEVIQTVSLAEFDLLRDTRTNIRRLPWTQPARRDVARLYFGIKRAKEEIQRLNVEITRLITFTIDEHINFYRAIVDTYMTVPHLAHELSVRWQYQARINNSVIQRLVKASRLLGFTGSLFPGKRIDMLGLSQVVVEYEEENDYADTARELDGLDTDQMIQLMESLEIDSIDIA